MAGPDSNDNIKEKVQSVREVVPGKSNNEIVLVLQYYDYNVEKAIQAYLEDGAKEALGEWHVPPKPNKKKKNKKKAVNSGQADNGAAASASGAAAAATVASSSTPSSAQPLPQRVPPTSNGISSSSSSSSPGSGNNSTSLPNGDLTSGSVKDVNGSISPGLEAAAAQVSTSTNNTSPPSLQAKQHNHRSGTGSHGHNHAHGHAQRTRTASERSTASSVGAGGDNHSRRLFHGLEKSIKDLQRQTTSLERLRLLLDHEIDRSYKSIKSVFEEMRAVLNTREKEMMTEMDVVKQQAYEVFKMRQEKAAMLKVHIERAEKLSESELGDLRADVKHFVADRKIDEELGKTTRFQYDSDHLKEEILRFGNVLPVKSTYTARRPSVSSVASSGPGVEDVQPPLSLHPDPVTLSAPVLDRQSPQQGGNQMTTEELASLQMRLQNSLKIQGLVNDSKSPPNGNSNSVADDGQKTKSARRRNRNRERQDQRKTEEESVPSTSPTGENNSRAATPSSTHASAGSASPSPQRGQRSPQRGVGYRGRGRGGQGSGGYRGGGNTGRGRPYSGGGRGGGGDQYRYGRGQHVMVNGTPSHSS